MTDLTKWKFRASQMGRLMAGVKPNLTENQEKTLNGLLEKKSNGTITDKQLVTLGDLMSKRDAKPKLMATAKTLCREIFQEQFFGRSKNITNKYLEKGISQEEHSLSLYTSVTGNLLFKNEDNFVDDHFTGTPDNIEGKVRDIKTSWDYSTFPFYENEATNSTYIYQLNTYMALTELDSSELIYCLVDTPFNLVDDELRRLCWKSGCLSLDSLPKKVMAETVQNLIYTEQGLKDYCHQSADVEIEWFDSFKRLRDEDRIKIFDVSYDENIIKSMRSQVEFAREYFARIMQDFVN